MKMIVKIHKNALKSFKMYLRNVELWGEVRIDIRNNHVFSTKQLHVPGII